MTDSASILQILQSINANIGNLSFGFLPNNNPTFIGTLSGVNETLSGTFVATGNVTTSADLTSRRLFVGTSGQFNVGPDGATALPSVNFGGTALANYVEGTWVPSITTSGTVGTPAYSIQIGSYTRIGRIVIAQFTLTLSGWSGSPAGNISISGLPLTSSATANDNASCYISQYSVAGLASLNYGVMGTISPSSTQINLRSQGNSGTVAITAAQAGTTASFIGNCVYHV